MIIAIYYGYFKHALAQPLVVTTYMLPQPGGVAGFVKPVIG